MSAISIAFWGAFFGSAALAGSAAILAFSRAAPRVARTGLLAVLLSSAYATVFLGWVPSLSGAGLLRLQAVVAIAAASVLCLLLFTLLGTFRTQHAAVRARWAVIVLAATAIAAMAGAGARSGLQLAVGLAFVLAGSAFVASVRSARRGERAGWLTLVALPCLFIGMAGLDWYALYPANTPWQVHAVSALAGMGYILCVGSAMWSRYAYLIEVRNIAMHGPNFDPISRMPSYENASALKEAFGETPGRDYGVVVVSISNLSLVEQLHGRAAYNHALFVCASRLRKLGFAGVDLFRLPEDSFVLLTHNPTDPQHLVDQARSTLSRLARPITLHTSHGPDQEIAGERWEASLGIGIVMDPSDCSLDIVITGGRAISRTAWSYGSRMAWYDDAVDSVCELPARDDSAPLENITRPQLLRI